MNNTGAGSQFLNSTIARLIGAQRGSAYNDLDLRRALHNSQVISADANDSINPIFPSTSEATNAARLGYGVTIKLYGEGFRRSFRICREDARASGPEWHTVADAHL